MPRFHVFGNLCQEDITTDSNARLLLLTVADLQFHLTSPAVVQYLKYIENGY